MCVKFTFIPLFYFIYPETSNKGLEDIDFLFVGGSSGLPYGSHKATYSIDSEKGEGVSDKDHRSTTHVSTVFD